MEKAKALLRLVEQRRSASRDGYACLADFQNGIFECDYITPWSKSGHNLNASVMIIGQDWVSGDVLSRYPRDSEVAIQGFDPKFPTNSNLNRLLEKHFGLTRAECYLTNLFVLIKRGNASASIRLADLVWSAKQFTLKEIEIVSPRLVICLGLRVFQALMRAAGFKEPSSIEQAIGLPFRLGSSTIHCVAHTGAFGMNNRSRDRVETDWQELAKSYARGKI